MEIAHDLDNKGCSDCPFLTYEHCYGMDHPACTLLENLYIYEHRPAPDDCLLRRGPIMVYVPEKY